MQSWSVAEIVSGDRPSISFEFFPPKSEQGVATLWAAISELEDLDPSFVSVTYGAGGTTRDRTIDITARIVSDTSLLPVGHLTCVGATENELRAVLEEYRAAGVRNILALRGDPPTGPGAKWEATAGGLNYASELVALARSVADFSIGVAAFPDPHPASGSFAVDIEVLRHKERAGASFAVTQFFFEAEAYFALVSRARDAGITLPIIPGIMPVTNLAQISRFATLSGTQFPPALRAQFEAAGESGVPALGIEHATRLCQELLNGGAPGLHFYTLNRSTATRQIYAELSLAPAR